MRYHAEVLVSADKDGKAGRGGPPVAKPATKTVIGVPSLPVPPDRPSDMEMTRELPPKGASPDASDQQETVHNVKAITSADAERVLASPAVVGAVPKAPRAGGPAQTPVGPRETVKGIPRAPSNRPPMDAEKATRPGVAPQPGISPKGRSTLLLDSSAPPSPGAGDTAQEGPPIVVPGTTAMPPNSVTQPPPWGEGAVRVGPPIPKGTPPPRSPEPSVEEISSSLLLPDASGEAPAAGVEELSGSLLIEDPPDGKGLPVVTKPIPATSRTPSVKPPVPKSTSTKPMPAPHRSLLGMPELPKATPAPNLERLSGSIPNAPGSSPASKPPFAAAVQAPPPAPSTPPPLPPLSEPVAPPVASPDAHVAAPVVAPVAAPPPRLGPDGIPLPDIEMPDIGLGNVVWPPPQAPKVAPAGSPGAEPSPPPVTGDIELTKLPRGGLAPALDAAKAALARARELLAKGAQQLGPTYRKARTQLGPAIEKARARVEPLLKRVSSNDTRPPWFLPVVAVAGLAVGIGLVAIIVSAVRGGGDHGRDVATRASATATATVTALPPATATATAPPTPASAALAACTVSGAPHVIAPNATLTAGVEVVRAGGGVAVGFASTDHDALAARLDVASLQATATAKARSRDVVRRVAPIESARGTLALIVDADRKADRLQGRRTVLADPTVQIGASGSHLGWSRVGGPPAGELWTLEDGPPLDALRGAAEGSGADRTVAIAFRRGSAIWMGTATGDGALAPKGELSHVEGLGTAVGSPAIALSGGKVLVAWADRPSTDEPWRLRWTRFDAGGAPTTTQTFAPPAGGRGEQAMSPGVAALPAGRFLLVWTEGPASGHDVRALTLGPDGAPIGAPLVISNVGVNAGQGQAAVADSGQGVVAFLESSGAGFQVVATPIVCP